LLRIGGLGLWLEFLFTIWMLKTLSSCLNFLLDIPQTINHNKRIMKHLIRLFTDTVLGFVEGTERIQDMFRKKPQPSLLAANIVWCTHSEWMDRLVSYKQLELWTADK
jgi:hypothetical protein